MSTTVFPDLFEQIRLYPCRNKMRHIGRVSSRDSKDQHLWIGALSAHLLDKREEILRFRISLRVVDKEGRYLRERFVEVNECISKKRRSQLPNHFSYRHRKFACYPWLLLLRSCVELLMDLHQRVLHNVHRVVIDDPSHRFKHYVSPIPLVSTFLPPLRLISDVLALQHFVTFQKKKRFLVIQYHQN